MANAYTARFNRVVDYIEEHLGATLTLDELADIACFSKYHFARLFQANQGDSLFAFIRRLRLERAASLLLTHPRLPVTEVALQCGFDNPSAFSRSFRKRFGMSATAWRACGGQAAADADLASRGMRSVQEMTRQWERHGLVRRSEAGRPVWETVGPAGERRVVTVRGLDDVTLAYVRHVGPYAADLELFEGLFERLFRWAAPRGLVRYPLVSYCLYHDSPGITPDDKLRVSVCIPVSAGTEVSGDVGLLTIPAGQYACATMRLGPADYGEAWSWVYGYWLPASGYEPADGASFERYLTESADQDQDEAVVVDICVPVRPAG